MSDSESLGERASALLDGLRGRKRGERPEHRIYAVVGLGAFGGVIATELMRFGNDVIGIDSDPRVVAEFADKLSQAVIVDARDETALKDAGIGDCDVAIVGTASNLEASVLSVVNLKFVGVSEIWAKAGSRTHHRILTKLGVNRVIHPEEETGRRVAQILHNPRIRDYASLGNGYYVVNLSVGEMLAGRRMSEFDTHQMHKVRVIGIMRGSEYLGASSCEVPLEKDDRLVLLGTRPDLYAFAETN